MTIVSDSATAADALSTIIFIAGRNRGIGILRKYPGTEAILVDEDVQVYITEGLIGCYEPCEGIRVNFIP